MKQYTYQAEKNDRPWTCGDYWVLRTEPGTTARAIIAQCDEWEAKLISDTLNSHQSTVKTDK